MILRRFVFVLIFIVISGKFRGSVPDSLIRLLPVSKKDTNRVALLFKISNAFLREALNDSAYRYILMAKDLSAELNYNYGRIVSLARTGVVLKEKGEYEQAFEVLMEALQLSEKTKNKKGLYESTVNLGALFIRMHKYPEAEKYYLKAQSLLEEFNDPKLEIDINTKLGTIYVAQKNYSGALRVLSKAEQILEKNPDEISSASVYGIIGRIFMEQDNFPNSEKYFLRALEIGEKYKSKHLISRGCSYLGKLHRNQCEKFFDKGELFVAQKHFKEAKKYFERFHQLVSEIGDHNARCVVYYDLYLLYKMQNNYKEALNYHELFSELNDSLLQIENSKSISDLNLKYETDLKDKEIKLLNKEKEQKEFEINAKTKNQKLILSSSIVLLVSMILLSVFIFRSYRQKQKVNLEKIEKEKVKAELSLLKNQISPHVMFNSLNSIFFQIDENKNLAKDMVLKFADLLRYQLYDCNVDFVEIEKETNYLQKFVEIQQIRKSNRCKVDFQIEPQVSNFLIAPLLLIPLIENAFKYVTNDKDSENFVNITLSKKDTELRLNVKNTCYPEQEKTEYGGIGLINLKSRLQLIYPGRHTLELKKESNTFNAQLTIHVG